MRKADFVLALGRLGLVLTHGQAATLATKHHGDYERFLAKLGDPRRRSPEVRGKESTRGGGGVLLLGAGSYNSEREGWRHCEMFPQNLLCSLFPVYFTQLHIIRCKKVNIVRLAVPSLIACDAQDN